MISPILLKRCISVYMVELALGGSVTNQATMSSFIGDLMATLRPFSLHRISLAIFPYSKVLN